MDGEAQYIADTFLLERTFQVLAELEESEGPLRKYAFDISSILGSIGQSIKTFVGGQVHGQDSGGVARTVLNFLAPAVFFRLHPILGILVTGAQLFGFDLYSIFQRIVNAIKPLIMGGQPITAQQVNDAAKSAMPQAAGMPTTASDDLLAPLRAMHNEGQLTKEAVGNTWQAANRNNPFMPKGRTSPLLRMFSFLGPQRGSGIIVGILVWFLKTVLMSAGLLAVGGVAAGALGLGSGQGQQGQTTPAGQAAPAGQAQTPVSLPQPAAGGGIPAPSAAGNWNYRPKAGDIWIEELGGGQPHERVLEWVIESYPDLYQYQDIILRTPSFWTVAKGISQNWRPGQSQMEIPEPYKTRNEILKMFIPDVYRMIQQYGAQQ
jgi:hypothetical protein